MVPEHIYLVSKITEIRIPNSDLINCSFHSNPDLSHIYKQMNGNVLLTIFTPLKMCGTIANYLSC